MRALGRFFKVILRRCLRRAATGLRPHLDSVNVVEPYFRPLLPRLLFPERDLPLGPERPLGERSGAHDSKRPGSAESLTKGRPSI